MVKKLNSIHLFQNASRGKVTLPINAQNLTHDQNIMPITFVSKNIVVVIFIITKKIGFKRYL